MYDPKEFFKYLYGENESYDEAKVPKEYYKGIRLYLKGYDETMIYKAKTSTLAIGYDELLEFIHNDESTLSYPEFYEIEATEKNIKNKMV